MNIFELMWPWILRIPPDMVPRLAGLQAPEFSRIAKKWAAIEEFVADGWTVTSIQSTFIPAC